MKSLIICLLSLFAIGHLLAQEEDFHRRSDRTFSFSASIGTDTDLGGKIHYEEGVTARFAPSLGVRLAVRFGPLFHFGGVGFYSSASLALTQHTARTNTPWGAFMHRVQRFPVILAFEAIAPTRLSPFIRLGLGMASTDFKRSYPSDDSSLLISSPAWGFRIHCWQACTEATFGFVYALSPNLDIDLAFSSYGVYADLTGEDGEGHKVIFWAPNGLNALTLGFTYSL